MTLPLALRQPRNIEVFLGRALEAVEANVGLDGFTAETDPARSGVPLEPGATLEGAISVGTQLFPFAGEVRWTAAVVPSAERTPSRSGGESNARRDEEQALGRRRFAVRITWVSDEYFRALRAAWSERQGSK